MNARVAVARAVARALGWAIMTGQAIESEHPR
jgi:hypothetical protein